MIGDRQSPRNAWRRAAWRGRGVAVLSCARYGSSAEVRRTAAASPARTRRRLRASPNARRGTGSRSARVDGVSRGHGDPGAGRRSTPSGSVAAVGDAERERHRRRALAQMRTSDRSRRAASDGGQRNVGNTSALSAPAPSSAARIASARGARAAAKRVRELVVGGGLRVARVHEVAERFLTTSGPEARAAAAIGRVPHCGERRLRRDGTRRSRPANWSLASVIRICSTSSSSRTFATTTDRRASHRAPRRRRARPRRRRPRRHSARRGRPKVWRTARRAPSARSRRGSAVVVGGAADAALRLGIAGIDAGHDAERSPRRRRRARADPERREARRRDDAGPSEQAQRRFDADQRVERRGMRTEPPVSVPVPRTARPAATATAEPPARSAGDARPPVRVERLSAARAVARDAERELSSMFTFATSSAPAARAASRSGKGVVGRDRVAHRQRGRRSCACGRRCRSCP